MISKVGHGFARCFYCQHQVRYLLLLSLANLNSSRSFPTCFERAGGERATQPLPAGALHPQLVLRSWSEMALGYGANAVWQRVPLAIVFARALTRGDTHSGTYTHSDPVDHA